MENIPKSEQDQDKPKNDSKSKQRSVMVLMLEAGTEFAFLIAVPLVAGLLAGRWLDAKYHHHFFVIIGILLGIAVSWVGIWGRIKDYRRMLK